jgi:hypothetical protein
MSGMMTKLKSRKSKEESEREFQPLEIMGVFWVFFGTVVLAATFFVEATERVPALHGRITNLIAGGILLGAGVLAYLRGRRRRKSGKGI